MGTVTTLRKSHHTSTATRRLLRAVCSLTLAALILGLGGAGRPASVAVAQESTSPITTATIDGATFTMSTPAPAIPDDTGTIDYRIALKPGPNATSIQLRIKVSTAAGTLIFSRTRYLNDLGEDGAQLRVEQFTREVAELRLKPGTYQVACEIAVATATHRTEDELRDHLVVYDPSGPAVRLAPTLKLRSTPMRSPEGTFLVDPASPEAIGRLDAVARLAAWVNASPESAVTLSISPLLLEEWTDITDGYTLAEPDSSGGSAGTAVVADDPTPRRYALALADLLAATESGRLTIAAGGYADPDLTVLASLGREQDILAQYRRGGRTFVSVEATETGVALATALTADGGLTAPVATTLTPESLDGLVSAGIDTVVLPESAILSGAEDSSAVAGSAISFAGITAVVANAEVSAALASDLVPRSVLLAALHYQLDGADRGAAVGSLSTFGTTPENTTATLTRLSELASLPWVTLVGVRELGTGVSDDSAELADLKSTADAWGDSVDPAAVGETLSRAEAATLMTEGIEQPAADDADTEDDDPNETPAGVDPQRLGALDCALIAEYAGPSSLPSALPTLRADYAARAAELADGVLNVVKLSVRPVTLPSVEGEVPITIVNEGETPLKVRVEVSATDGLTFIGADSPDTVSEDVLLEAGETFRNPAVALHNAPDGRLTVRILAGSYVVTEESVTVGASYINMIATVGLVVLAGLALVAYVYSRVKRSPTPPTAWDDEHGGVTSRNLEERP